MAPRRVAALAVCLLAMAAGAAAANECSSKQGFLTMELFSATGTGATSSELAKCLSSVKVTLDTHCNVDLESLSSGGAFIPSIFTDSSLAGDTYKQFKECPSTSAATVSAGTNPIASTDVTATGTFTDALLTQLKKFAYQGARDTAGLANIQILNGIVTVQDKQSGPTVVYKYAIKEATMTVPGVPSVPGGGVATPTGTDMVANTEYFANANIGQTCAAGRYGLVVKPPSGASIKVCFLCPVGTYGDGNGCTAVSAGKASDTVGATQDPVATCAAGTYAQGGNSDCLPCPAGSFSAAGAGQCTDCPAGSYSWIPGSAACYKCINGVPTCMAGSDGGSTCTNNNDEPSPGYHVLSVSQLNWPANLAAPYKPDIYAKCSSWASTPTLQLALEVAGDCSITIRPITDTSCSDPGAVSGQQIIGQAAGTTYQYTYNDLIIRAYYQTSTAIRTQLPTDGATTVKSFMMAIDKPTPAEYSASTYTGNELKLRFWGATDDVAASDLTSDVATNKVTAIGGTVVGLPASAIDGTNCPDGTYASDDDNYCTACPQGHYCAAGVMTPCDADYANPLLGAKASGACTQCSASLSPRFTSLPGAGYCTVKYFERNCQTDGTYWDESSMQCEDCPAGTFRAGNDANNLECRSCDPGTYSKAKAGSCTACPAGQYSPSYGLADQSTANEPRLHCLRCPVGSVALTAAEALPAKFIVDNSVLTATDDYRNDKALPGGATVCMACPDGTFADKTKTAKAPTVTGTAPNEVYANTATSCTLCPTGTYRIGDASPMNNKCNPIPAGYKAKTLLVGTTAIGAGATELVCTSNDADKAKCKGAFEIEACGKGTVSSWNAGFIERTPGAPTTCKSCTNNEYAPRPGMAKCLACRGGTKPATSNGAGGPDYCTPCDAGYFRGALTATQAGSYKAADGSADSKDFCTQCPMNSYATRIGATGCIDCPRGTETQDEGNTECTACAVGYYKRTGGRTSCIEAEAGTFVNTTGAFTTTPCPVGTFTDKAGQDSCDPCPAGQYANTRGSQSCKTCPAGTISIGQAATCKSCTAGFYAPAGSGICSPCKPGTFADAARSGSCKRCPKGKQCPTPAMKVPQDCPAGTFAAKDGSSLCTPCPVNFFQASRGQTKCTPCAPNYNTRGQTGQRACSLVRVTGLRRSQL
ncbi:serine threonine [Chlorella sorokiniana]|uniref:Serine threonine n=1 Tax=Chlorella sorokiniana TaxID=3076 RepID=A0A2P6TZD7_CHLSO|nr:serine threonine [Chlorella sorokiniana]|eukprot:PRW59428.1 serine threonine [Chlorella sorokiniana]